MKGPSARIFCGDEPSLDIPVMLLFSPLYSLMARDDRAEKLNSNSFRRLVRLGDWGLLPLPMGAPMAARLAEHLAVCGAKGLLQAGIAGSLDDELPAGSLIRAGRFWNQTGTAAMYGFPWDGVMNFPERPDWLPSLNGLFPGPEKSVWSADGLYCETDELIAQRREDGMSAVEMEGAALAAVCSRYNLPFEALFCISDELFHDEWKPAFKSPDLKAGLDSLSEKLTDLAFS